MDSLSTHVFPISGSGGWGVRVKTGAGVAVEYHYGTESQARFMAAVLKLGPTRLPPAQRLVADIRRRKHQAKRAQELASVTAEEIDGALAGLPAEGFEDDGEGIDIEIEEFEPVSAGA